MAARGERGLRGLARPRGVLQPIPAAAASAARNAGYFNGTLGQFRQMVKELVESVCTVRVIALKMLRSRWRYFTTSDKN
jgi:hypothetical protein